MDELKHNTDQASKMRPKKLLSNEAGQASIFLGMSLLVIVSFVAFVINVGLFVKAKINLQNAVDASAYAGAATQARQLTNIAHLNWEMRNTFKEWMMKYYVFGNVGLDAVESIEGSESNCARNTPLNNGGMNFRLRQFTGSSCKYHDSDLYDRYNVPSICIHYGSSNNICEIVSLPGLPRFNTVGLPSISEQHESFLNEIVSTKSTDCAQRSQVNQGAAMLWTYGIGSADMFPGVPEVAASRIGSWVQALELAMRMRNLEAIMNTPPQDGFVCKDASTAKGLCSYSIDNISNTVTGFPLYERVTKAFWSGYRNLSGGVYKSQGASVDFGESYSMREIPPTPMSASPTSLSGYLIPTDSSVGSVNPLEKYYVDFKLMPINYSIFYTSFFTTTGTFANSSDTPEEAKCGGTKTALPVPGYLLGFFKNPEVVTYYAVEGQAKFTGLFFPFLSNDTDSQGITLKTYAAAKPFGGRIGPMLFEADGSSIKVRTNNRLSANYASAFDVSTISAMETSTDYDEKKKLVSGGYPIPISADYWLSPTVSQVAGGNPLITEPKYVIPNLIYDFDSYGDIDTLGLTGGFSGSILSLNEASSEINAYEVSLLNEEGNFGLYNKTQFTLFKDNRVDAAGAAFSDQDIISSIINSRRPTRYEALNYLVPILDSDGSNPLGIDANSYIHPAEVSSSTSGYQDSTATYYSIYAPFINDSGLFKDPAAARNVIQTYIDNNQQSIDVYLESLKNIHDIMVDVGSNTSGGDSYTEAAKTIYNTDISDCDNLAMAQKFELFFANSESETCGITPLALHVEKYFTNKYSSDENWKFFYNAEYKEPRFDASELLSAYRPGERQGANDDGTYSSPFSTESTSGKRNSYSTKFFPISDALSGGNLTGSSGLPLMSEGTESGNYTTQDSTMNFTMQNYIPSSELSDYGNDPKF